MRKVLIPLDGKYAGLLRIESFCAPEVEMLRKILVPLETSMMQLECEDDEGGAGLLSVKMVREVLDS